jgi:hypothetical protein
VRFVPSVLQIPMRLHFANANNSEVVTGKHSKGKLFGSYTTLFWAEACRGDHSFWWRWSLSEDHQ